MDKPEQIEKKVLEITPTECYTSIQYNEQVDSILIPSPVTHNPTNLNSIIIPNGVALSWNAPSHENEANIIGYRIYREHNNETPQLVGTKTGFDNTNFVDIIALAGLQPNSSYWYHITAFNSLYESPKSDKMLVTTSELTSATPPPSASLLTIRHRSNDIFVSWNISDLSGTYRLSRFIDGYDLDFIPLGKIYDYTNNKNERMWYKEGIAPNMRNKNIYYMIEHIAVSGHVSNPVIDLIKIGR